MVRRGSLIEDQHDETELAAADSARSVRPVISIGFALLLVACTIWSVDLTSPALPAITEDFGLSVKGAGLIVSFLFIGRLLGNIPAARLLETQGSPRTASLGALVLVAGALTNILAPVIAVLYAGRVLQGIGIALLVNAGLRSILYARPGRGSAMTIYGIASTIGSVLGLQSSGVLTGAFGWRSVFLLSAVLGMVLVALPMTGARLAGRSRRQDSGAAPVASAAVPLRSYLAPLAVNFLVFCSYSIWVILPLYAQRTFAASPEVTANLLLVITVMHLAAAVPVGRAIRRFGAERTLTGAAILAVLGTVGILLAPSVWWLTLPLVLYGTGMIGSVNAVGDVVLQRGGAGAKAVGSLRQSSDLGLVIGPIGAGFIADAFGDGAPFVTFPVLMAIAVAAVLIPNRRMTRALPEYA